MPESSYKTVSQTVRLPGQLGVVAIFVKDNFPVTTWDCKLPEFDFACGLVLCSEPSVLIIPVYISPLSSAFHIDNEILLNWTTRYINIFLSTFPHGVTAIISDCNLPSICWRSYSSPDTFAQVIIDHFDNLNCQQLTSEPTHTNGNKIFRIFTNKPELCLVSVDRNTFNFDQYPVSFSYHVSPNDSYPT